MQVPNRTLLISTENIFLIGRCNVVKKIPVAIMLCTVLFIYSRMDASTSMITGKTASPDGPVMAVHVMTYKLRPLSIDGRDHRNTGVYFNYLYMSFGVPDSAVKELCPWQKIRNTEIVNHRGERNGEG